MTQLRDLGKTAFAYYVGCTAFVLILWVFAWDLPLAAVLAALALIPLGGVVVGVLIKLSFEHHSDDDGQTASSDAPHQ